MSATGFDMSGSSLQDRFDRAAVVPSRNARYSLTGQGEGVPT